MAIEDLAVLRQPADGAPVRPGAVLLGHVVLKGVQAGSFIGTAVGLLSSLRWPNTSITLSAGRGALIGAPVGAAMVLLKATQIDEEGVIDRGYRIMHNEHQVFVDTVSSAGGVVGLAIARRPPFGIGSAAVGMAAALLACPGLFRIAYTPGGWANL
mmetsp:Transcript_19766/g.42643  ORF Transcript_19766/g.42643 Transcript_19766/m.42643 type:complete len:156 (+) Transcript_19766:180-647(+)|eukprot:6209333-Pleurochrysis_carterae.AAC.2